MATSIVLSGLVALTLTPVLCAMILKPHTAQPRPQRDHGKKRLGSRVMLLYVLGGLLILGLITYLAYYLWGPVGFLLILLPFVRRPFDRARREGHGRLCGDPAADRHTPHADHGRHRGLCRRHRLRQHAAADGLHPGRGPGHHLRGPPDASGLDARVHQRQVPGARGDRQGDRGSHLGHLVGRLRGSDRRPRLERGDLYHQLEELVRPQADRDADHRRTRGKMP